MSSSEIRERDGNEGDGHQMGSRKPSANKKRVQEFKSGLDDWGALDDLFEREHQRKSDANERHEAALRHKACESKNRYLTQAEAEATILECAAHGTTAKLHSYRCPYCDGWHITSKPKQESQER